MNKDITIARRFNTILEGVTELNIDLSYNKEEALRDIKALNSYRDLKVTAVFADTDNQLWYIIRSVREGLNLLHKYVPFHNCLSNAPFQVYSPSCAGDDATVETATKLLHIGRAPKCEGARQEIAKRGFIAG